MQIQHGRCIKDVHDNSKESVAKKGEGGTIRMDHAMVFWSLFEFHALFSQKNS